MASYRWKSLSDPEFDVEFVVSPRSGSLLALPKSQWSSPAGEALLVRERLLPSLRTDELINCDENQGYIAQPVAVKGTLRSLALMTLWRCVAAMSRWLPLRFSFVVLGRIACWCQMKPRSMERILDLCMFAERKFHPRQRNEQCLPRAMMRYLLLNAHGHEVEANIGVWTPTDMMHAWVSQDGEPIGEEREEVMHYQTCLRFYGSCRLAGGKRA